MSTREHTSKQLHLTTRFPFVANEILNCDIKELFDLFFQAPSEDRVEEDEEKQESDDDGMPALTKDDDDDDWNKPENEGEDNPAANDDLDAQFDSVFEGTDGKEDEDDDPKEEAQNTQDGEETETKDEDKKEESQEGEPKTEETSTEDKVEETPKEE